MRNPNKRRGGGILQYMQIEKGELYYGIFNEYTLKNSDWKGIVVYAAVRNVQSHVLIVTGLQFTDR